MTDYFRFEKKEDDFPFYNDQPRQVSTSDWIKILGMTFIGFLLLSFFYLPFLSLYLNELVAGIILPVFALIGLRVVLKKDWTALFKKIHWHDILLVFLYVLAALLIAGITGFIIEHLAGPLADNPVADQSKGKNALLEFLSLRFQEIFQLFGEEFLAILPFLALLQFGVKKMKLKRKTAIIGAWILSSVVFGLLHLPTYNWNIIQCIFVIGSSRMILTLPYMKTKNMWISYFVHYLYDMLIFSFAFFS